MDIRVAKRKGLINLSYLLDSPFLTFPGYKDFSSHCHLHHFLFFPFPDRIESLMDFRKKILKIFFLKFLLFQTVSD